MNCEMLYSLLELYRLVAHVSPVLEEKEREKNSDKDAWNLVFNAAFFQILSFSFPYINEE